MAADDQQVLRVLWLAKGLGRGGTERLLATSIPFIDRSRFEVEVAYVLPWKDAFVAEIEKQGVPVHCLGDQGRRLGWIPGLRRLARSFDVVHSHMPVPGVVARLVLPRRRPRLVHTEHNMWSRYRPFTRWANALTLSRNEIVIAVSAGVAESMWAPGPLRIPPVEVLLHGPDPSAVRSGEAARRAARATLGLPMDAPVLGTVGNFTAKKDQRRLLEATAMLATEFPTVRLVMVGDGPLADELRSTASALGVDERVLFTGPRDDVAELLPAFDVFALSSLHEGFSIALLEAMSTGLPCVATRVGGNPEAMEDGVHGFLVPAAEPEALAEAIAVLLRDPSLRREMGSRALEQGSRVHLATAVARTQAIYGAVGVST